MIEAIFSVPLYVTLPIVLVGYSISCLGIGLLFLRFFEVPTGSVKRISPATMVATAFILGQGILASFWLLLALAGWFSIEIVGSVCFIFSLVALFLGRSFFSSLARQIVSIWQDLRADTWGWQLIAGLTTFLCLLWITSLGRPLLGDGTAFYMPLGKLIAFSHRLTPLPGYEAFTNIGLQGELHFAALMALHNPDAAKLFAWPTMVMAGIMLVSLGRLVGMGRRGQWITLSILFSSSAVIYLSGDGKVDLFAVAFGVAAYYWAVQVRFAHTTMALLLTGLFSGFAIVAKMSYAVIMVPTIALLVLWAYWPALIGKDTWRSGLRSFMAGSVVIFVGLFLALIPHLIKNGLLYQNPIAPIGSGMGWLNQTWFGADVTRRILLTYPLALTYGSYWAQYGNISPLVLAFLPVALYLPRPRSFFSSPLVVLTLAALVGTVVWIVFKPSIFSPRYILALLLLFSLLPARSAEYASRNDQKPRLLATTIPALTVLTLISAGFYFSSYVFAPNAMIKYLTGEMGECKRDGEYCSAMNAINKKADAGDRVYVASYQSYWFRGDLLQCISGEKDRLPGGLSQEELWLDFYEKGFEFLLLDKSSHGSVGEQLDLEHPPGWVILSPLYTTDQLFAYQVKFDQVPSTAQPADCQRVGSSTVWEVVYP